MQKRYLKQGFTLVELSIVIIIIGFLIAGIASGQSLIRQAQLNSIITDMQNYQTAYNAFIQRYSSVPGDMVNPDAYWPAGSGGCAITAGNCNGNGDGLIQFNAGVNDESYAAWRQLSLAGIIIAGTSAMPDAWDGVEVVGETVPASKISGAGWILTGGANIIGGTKFGHGAGTYQPDVPSQWFDGVTNAVYLGKPSSTSGLAGAAINSKDAFNIDQKIDDGDFASGTQGNIPFGASSGRFRASESSEANGYVCQAGSQYYSLSETVGCVPGFALN